jgi:thiol-disulfide isomerase/thioredoxin
MKFRVQSILLLFSFIVIIGCGSSSHEVLPSFSAQTIDGKLIQIDSLKGKIIVIDIWATWCGNCINELNSLNAVVEKYKSDGNVVFIAITDEPNEKVNRFLQHRDFNFQHIANAATLKNLLHKSLIQEIPKTMVINKNREIVLDLIGEKPNIENILSSVIDKELKNPQH